MDCFNSAVGEARSTPVKYQVATKRERIPQNQTSIISSRGKPDYLDLSDQWVGPARCFADRLSNFSLRSTCGPRACSRVLVAPCFVGHLTHHRFVIQEGRTRGADRGGFTTTCFLVSGGGDGPKFYPLGRTGIILLLPPLCAARTPVAKKLLNAFPRFELEPELPSRSSPLEH